MHLRVATPLDAAAVHRIYAPAVRDTVISFEIDPPSEAELAGRITATLERYPWLVAEEGGEVLGYAYASRHRDRAAYGWAAELAVYVDPRAHRRGVGRALYLALLPLLERQGVHTVYAGITLPNPASVGLHEAVGLTRVGVYREVGFKLGRWHDVGWWEKVLGPPGLPAGPVRPFPSLGALTWP